jgi:hypothetical protein
MVSFDSWAIPGAATAVAATGAGAEETERGLYAPKHFGEHVRYLIPRQEHLAPVNMQDLSNLIVVVLKVVQIRV